MSTLLVDHEDFSSFLFAIGHFHENTPNRWALVAEFIQSQTKSDDDSSRPKVCLGKTAKITDKAKCCSLRDLRQCQSLYKVIKSTYPSLLKRETTQCLFKSSGKTAFKPIILLPPKSHCCGRKLKMDSRPSFPIIYTMKGTFVGAQFHGECGLCKNKYYPSYLVTEKEQKFYYDPLAKENAYFQVTSKTVFDIHLLQDISNNIWVTGSTFQSRAKVYNLNFAEVDKERLNQLEEFARSNDSEWKLNEQRVNDAWFMWLIVNYYNSKGTLSTTDISYGYNKSSHRLNTEDMCERMWKEICASKNKWVQHSCKTPGCSEGYVTVDGNEYLKRSKCALPKKKVKPRKDLPEIFTCCTNSPLTGGKHQVASKFCSQHQDQSHSNSDPTEVDIPPEFMSDKSEAGLLSEDALIMSGDNQGCKKKKNISLFYETTAGMLALIRPCGIVVNMTEMFTSESYTQVFLLILRTFCYDLEDVQRLKYLGYDRACGLVPYLKNQARNGSAGASLLLENVKFLVDAFHVSKHTEVVCMPPQNPNCKYHPSLPQFDAIRGVNTESCEQGFKRLNQYLQLTRKMTQYKRNVLFWFVNECFNTDLERELKGKGLL